MTNLNYNIITGDSEQVLKQYPDNYFDSVVCDPPYMINFLGKAWDSTVGSLGLYQECLRVLKPGGHILAFSAARTYHHLAITLEQAGFEIRDQIMWIYSSGFPKSQDVGRSIQRSLGVKKTEEVEQPLSSNHTSIYEHGARGDEKTYDKVVCTDPEAQQWSGWGTALKPAHEPICLARKPTKLSIARNVQEYGTGALNIDACRVPYEDPAEAEADARWRAKWSKHNVAGPVFQDRDITEVRKQQNKPKVGKMGTTAHENYNAEKNAEQGLREGEQQDWIPSEAGRFPSNVIGEIPLYQKYFYCPKVSRRERHLGYDTLPPVYDRREEGLESAGIQGLQKLNGEKKTEGGNNHPTVKPIALMEYLIKLVTQPGGHVLDPFNGSGSTGCAAVGLGYHYTGIELDPKYVEISNRRIRAWIAPEPEPEPNNLYHQLFE